MISARYTWAETKSDFGLAPLALNTGSVYNATLPDENSFNGKNTNQSFALSWTAVPTTNVDTRVYYYWTKLDNNSDLVEYGNAPTVPLASGLGCGNFTVNGIPTQTVGNCENELYNYTKNNVGFDVWWRFLKGQRLGFGYDYTTSTRPASTTTSRTGTGCGSSTRTRCSTRSADDSSTST